MKKRILFTVTNDLTYDQRMQRICGTLAAAGYEVQLIGRQRPNSKPLDNQPFEQYRLHCRFEKGFLFYAEYNLRLFGYLCTARYDAVCSIDLDTLAAGCLATLLRRKKRVFDAHEHFCEVPELVGRPFSRAFWGLVARLCLPFYRHAYTVGPALAAIFQEKYHVKFAVLRNVPTLSPLGNDHESYLLYQGALNAGRGIEQVIEALQYVDQQKLMIAGEGDLSAQLREKVEQVGLSDRIRFMGYIKPVELKELTAHAWVGLNLLENKGLSYYYSLANKFFDYVQAATPVITMNFPEYQALNREYEVAILLDNLNPSNIAAAIQSLKDPELYNRLQDNCLRAREEWNWEKEKAVLLGVWTLLW